MGIGIKVAIAAILFSIISGGYFFIKEQQAQLELAKEVQAKMEGVIEKQNLAMDNIKADVERMGQVQKELSGTISAAEKSTKDLAKKFTEDAEGRERNLAAMAAEKPSVVEEKINRFFIAEKRLISAGHSVYNPAMHSGLSKRSSVLMA